jgi:3-dehydroquinate synthase
MTESARMARPEVDTSPLGSPLASAGTTDVVHVALDARGYDIHVGAGLLATAGKAVRAVVRRPVVAVVTDDTVARFHLDSLSAALDGAGVSHSTCIVPPGESTKNFHNLEHVLEALLEARIERGDAVIALGGGVVGDLAGFAASILRRGVDVIQVPTTLLAQVDSAVGGKTAINTRHGKNLVGTFHQPRLVVADVSTLRTLPARELRAGYAEVVKYGLIDDPELFAWLERNGGAAIDGDAMALRRAVVASCRAKARIVASDERESGVRALLNLGHTFGHALEAETGYDDRLRHGEAVSIGLCLAFALSARLGLCAASEAERVRRHLASVGLPTATADVPGSGDWSATRLLAHMRQDKKVQDNRLTFILARGIGTAFIARDVSESDVLAVLDADLSRA